jgi:signal transduction histidine kinase/FixJ family two-component response regulator
LPDNPNNLSDKPRLFLRGKIIIIFLAGVLAIFSTWFLSRVAFDDMLSRVEELSEPNEKLKAVNQVFYQITHSGQLEKVLSSKSGSISKQVEELSSLHTSLNLLKELCSHNAYQVGLIDSVITLLHSREQLLLDYVNAKRVLLNYKPLSEDIEALEALLYHQAEKTDSIVFSSEAKKTTKTIKKDSIISEKQGSGFWDGLFRKNKVKPVTEEIVEEEFNSKVDTLIIASSDSVLYEAKNIVKNISEKQQQKRQHFARKEVELLEFDRIFLSRIITILHEIEMEIIELTSNKTSVAQEVVNKSAGKMNLILLSFFGLTAFLIILILNDISKANRYRYQLERAKEEAENHSRAKQRFLSNMSHEIRTPLQSILGYTEQLNIHKKYTPEYIDAIQKSSEHLLQLVNEILDYSRLISGKFTFISKPFDLNKVLDEVCLLMKPQVNQKNLNLVKEVNLPEGLFVLGDEFRLRQILINLLGNAVKFTEKGEVKLVAKNEGKNFSFSIIDTGIGIPEDKLNLIFDDFSQVYNPEEKNFGGTGLGLSIVKALVEGQNGKMEAKSKVNSGTEIKVQLQFETAEIEAENMNKQNSEDFRFDGKIWVVDDDKLILDLCSAILTKHNIKHTCFSKAEDVINEPADSEVTLLLSDIRLPGMDGFGLCKLLKERNSSLKIAAITAQALPEERDAILAEGFDFLLMKPFKEEALLELISNGSTNISTEPAAVETTGFSLDYLQSFTMGCKELESEIINNYIEECKTDSETLREAISAGDNATVVLLLHRLSGRTSQIGHSMLGTELRNLEKQAEKNGISTSLLSSIDIVLTRIAGFSEELKQFC